MSAWLRHHGRSLGATLHRLAQSPGATALNVLAIGVALALPLGAWVALANAERLGGARHRRPAARGVHGDRRDAR